MLYSLGFSLLRFNLQTLKVLRRTLSYANINLKNNAIGLIFMSSSQRPLSPHLQIYRPQITSMMSITHRLTGMILSSSLLLLAIMLTCMIKGPEVFAHFYAYSQHILSKIYLFSLCASFYFHLCNGVRHLFWDMGYGFEMTQVRVSGYLALGASIVLTLITWHMV